jgi:tetratricopeptide (TPR) repeat protein
MPFADSNEISLQPLLEDLLACTPGQLKTWIDIHSSRLDLQFIQQLKDTYADLAYIIAHPQEADRITSYAMMIAQALPEEPMALPLAYWARGLWELLHDPQVAIEHFRLALSAYEQIGDSLSVARLAGNLVGALVECGHFAAAEVEYHRAYPVVAAYVHDEPRYLLRLQQNYGWLLHNQGKYIQALKVHEQALEIALRHHLDTIAAEIRVNRALTLGMLGRLSEVEAEFLHDHASALKHQQALTVARIDMNLGELYTILGRPAAALRHFHLAQTAFSSLGNVMEVGSVTFRIAMLLQRIGSLRAALPQYAQALALFTQHDMQPQVGEILVNFASAQRLAGEYKRAALLLAQAEHLWRTSHNPHWLMFVFIELIELALERGDMATAQKHIEHIKSTTDELLPVLENPKLIAELQFLTAETLRQTNDTQSSFVNTFVIVSTAYEQALTFASAQGDRWLQRRALIGKGQLLRMHDPHAAQLCLEQAIAIDDEIRQTLSVEELKAGYHAQSETLFATLIQLAIEQDRPSQALVYTWQYKSSALVDLLQAVTVEKELSTTESAQLEQVRQQLATLRWALAMQTNAQVPDPVPEQTTPEITQLEQRLLELRQQRNRQYAPQHQKLYQQPAVVLATMEADLLLEYVCCNDHILGFCADRSGNCAVQQLAEVEHIADLVGRLQLHFQSVVTQPIFLHTQSAAQSTSGVLPLLAQCYDILVRPLLQAAQKFEGSPLPKSVLIAPCAPLSALPFAAFRDGQHFWVEHCQLELIQSGALIGLVEQPITHSSPPLIVAASTAAMTAVLSEAAHVATALPNSVSFVDTPVIDYLCRLESPPRLLHIATHSVIRDDAHLFSGLQFTGEMLSVEQCYELPLSGTELVTLSGCTTAAGLDSDASLLAFQSAFFVAGARRLLTSLWPVADDATAFWMATFYHHYSTGLPAAVALQRTQQFLLADPTYSHPAIWAAFVCTRR